MKTLQERFLKSTYLDKGTSFSASSLTSPIYQLWVKSHIADNDSGFSKSPMVGFKSAIGSAWHAFVEKDNEPSIIKEFSHVKKLGDISIGGTADELMWLEDEKKWQIRDHKTKGVYSAKKFLGVGTKANPNPMPDNEKERTQLSIYRWLFSELFPNISDTAVIYLWVMGHTARDPIPEISEQPLDLIPVQVIEKQIVDKLAVVADKKEPTVDCETSWLCNYCEYTSLCPDYARRHGVSFGDET